MKKFQLLKWTAEVREKELQFLFFNGHSVDLLDDSDVVECEYLDIRYPEGE